jgi:seryl-tRNA synthetase
MKVNFTSEHYAKMKELAFNMLISNQYVTTKLGVTISVVDLMHTQTINTLNSIRIALSKQIEDLEKQDEWVASNSTQERLSSLKDKKELVNLIIGWKRYNLEVEEIKKKREEITKQLNDLKESQKTPEDKIKELEEKLSSLDTENF